MQFVKSEDYKQGLATMTKRLGKELGNGSRVLWLVTGGSNIAITVAAMAELKHEHTKNLAVFLADERYGEVGHVDSNAKQLLDAGFMAKDAIFVPALAPGFSLEETRERYAEASKLAFEHADIIIGQIGIGSDGHVAGILPHSPAVDSTDWVIAYETPTYTRVTLGFPALRQLDVVYSFVFGDDKKPMLTNLHDEALPLDDQPAQLFKELPEVYIFNNQIGDKS